MVRRAFLLALLPMLAWGAPAGALDATFAGRWRVVDAAPAPWANGTFPRTLARTGVVFLEDRMLGHGALTCANARYDVVVSPAAGLFQGGLGERAEAAAAALGLSGDTTTLRVICDTGSFDFHHRNGTDLLIGYDNVIYTLRRPEDPQTPPEDADFIAPVAASFPCEAARSAAERLICGDERLSRADLAMSREYARLRGELTGRNLDALTTAQRAWLAFVHATCGVTGAMPQESEAREATRCLAGETESQVRLLASLRTTTAGPVRIEPRLNIRTDAARKRLEIDVTPEVVSAPGAQALRAFLAQRIPPFGRREAVPWIDGDDYRQTFTRDYRVHLADARLVSLTVHLHFETGVRVPARAYGVNWNVARGRPLALSDVFRPRADWQTVVLAAVEREAEPHFHDEARAAALREAGEIGRWSFRPDRAVLRFSTVSFPLIAEPADLDIPAAELAPLLRPDAPWRPAAR